MGDSAHRIDTTPERHYPLPYQTNELSRDVETLRMAIDMIRADAVQYRDMVSGLNDDIEKMIKELDEYAKNIPAPSFAEVPEGGFSEASPPDDKDDGRFVTPEYLEAFVRYTRARKD